MWAGSPTTSVYNGTAEYPDAGNGRMWQPHSRAFVRTNWNDRPVDSFRAEEAVTIGEVCNREVVITTPGESIGDAARLMRECEAQRIEADRGAPLLKST